MNIECKKTTSRQTILGTEIAEKNIVFVDHKNKTAWVKQEKIKAE